jgi:hypothetical protein
VAIICCIAGGVLFQQVLDRERQEVSHFALSKSDFEDELRRTRAQLLFTNQLLRTAQNRAVTLSDEGNVREQENTLKDVRIAQLDRELERAHTAVFALQTQQAEFVARLRRAEKEKTSGDQQLKAEIAELKHRLTVLANANPTTFLQAAESTGWLVERAAALSLELVQPAPRTEAANVSLGPTLNKESSVRR